MPGLFIFLLSGLLSLMSALRWVPRAQPHARTHATLHAQTAQRAQKVILPIFSHGEQIRPLPPLAPLEISCILHSMDLITTKSNQTLQRAAAPDLSQQKRYSLRVSLNYVEHICVHRIFTQSVFLCTCCRS